MKKITLKLFLAMIFMFSTLANAQCLESIEGLYPDATSTAATCDGIGVTTITTLAYASEYSNVEVTAGETYTFSSSFSTDYITISNDDGLTASAFGTTPVTWVADVTGVVRFYTHTDDLCGGNTTFRTRSYVCGIPPCVQPIVSFSKTFDCGSASFEVIADITDLGTASSITVTDDQGSASQSVSSAGPLTFGPYAFGTAVVLTATNDQTPICNVVSDSQVILACPPANDECSGAVSLNVNPDASCTDFISGTITAATASSVSTSSCGGTEDDDVWFSFVATDAIQTINLNNVVGSTTDLFHSLWSGDCDTLTLVPGSCSDANASVPTGLTAGETYYLRVYSWTGTPDQNVTFDVCVGTPPPPPANDECAGAIALNVNPDNNCTDVVSGTITSATGSLIDVDSCGGTEDDDVWFSFVATGSIQTISLNNVAGSTTDLFHSLWSGDCDNLALVPGSCSDANASIPTGLTAGETYYLRVYSWTATTGQDVTFDVCVGTPPAPPANDECANAVALNCGDVLTNQTTDSATGGTDTSCVGTIGNDVWYSFQGDGQVITLTATGLVEFPQVEVYASTDGSCTGFTPGTCIASAGTGESVASTSFVSQNGTTYYIHVGTWINGDPALTFDLSITCETPATPPSNDDCSGAESLTVNGDMGCAFVASGTINGATASAVDTAACGGSEDDDVWYSFVATDVIQAVSLINVVGSTTDLFHSIWTGDCDALTLVAGSCSDNDASVPTGLVAGQTYYIRVYSSTTTALQNTTFDICVGTPPPPPVNDDCTGAIEITAGGEFATSPIVASNVSATTTTGLPDSCQANRINEVWYSVVVPDSGSLTIETAAEAGTAMTDSVLTIYTGSCGSLVEVGCDDDAGTDNFSKEVLTGLTPGETLYIAVWRYSFGTGLDGTFQLSAYDASLLSNDTFDASSFRSFPNPVKNILNLSYNKNISNVAVYNLLGQEVIAKAMNANQSQIDMSHLSNGTYLVKVTSDNQVKTIKVIKE
jgi:hypothetical protein